MDTASRILVTGVTGQVAGPVARALAVDHEVFGAARFRNPASRDAVEDAGITPVTLDFEQLAASGAALEGLPDGIDYVCNFAIAKTNDFRRDLAANGEALGQLMRRYRDARAF